MVSWIAIFLSVCALIVSWRSYNFAQSVKEGDLWIEANRLYASIESLLGSLPEQLNKTKRSRQHVMSANGMFNSGHMEKYNREFDALQKRIEELQNSKLEAPNFGATKDFVAKQIVELNRVLVELNGIRDQLSAYYDEDEHERERIAIRSSTAPIGASTRSSFPSKSP